MTKAALILATSFIGGSALARPWLAGMVDSQTCSGSVVRFKGQSAKSPALILTNGHCIHLMKDGEVVEHVASSRDLTLLNDEGAAVARGFRPKEILYATMTGVDLALYQLNESFEELESKWRVPHRFLSDRAVDSLATDPLILVSGHFRRSLSCKPRGVADVREGDWRWQASLSLDDCEVEHGMSGSPLVSPTSGEVVAVINTFNSGTARACSQDNPCETTPRGIRAVSKRAYASPVVSLSSCVNAEGNFDSRALGCRLPSPSRP